MFFCHLASELNICCLDKDRQFESTLSWGGSNYGLFSEQQKRQIPTIWSCNVLQLCLKISKTTINEKKRLNFFFSFGGAVGNVLDFGL